MNELHLQTVRELILDKDLTVKEQKKLKKLLLYIDLLNAEALNKSMLCVDDTVDKIKLLINENDEKRANVLDSLFTEVRSMKLEFDEIKTATYNHSDRIDKIAKAAYDAKVPLFIDAEETWIQDAIDTWTFDMMLKYNKEEAIVYNTLQMYRHDRLEFLKDCYELAKKNDVFYGVKLVRGAYMEKERERAALMSYHSPIQSSKDATDFDYNAALKFIVKHADVFALCAGSHNEKSSLILTQLLNENNISPDNKQFYFAQLLGMSDHISYNLSHAGFQVAKYVPFGPVKEVMPYLLRRADENTSVAGQTGRELSLIMKELARRKGN
jgi:proline dehydrogenase